MASASTGPGLIRMPLFFIQTKACMSQFVGSRIKWRGNAHGVMLRNRPIPKWLGHAFKVMLRQLRTLKVSYTTVQSDLLLTDDISTLDNDATIAPLPGSTCTLGVDEPTNEEDLEEEDLEDEIRNSAAMDNRKPDISLIDLPPSNSNVLPVNYLWRQCAVFMEMKKKAEDGPLGSDVRNARKAEGDDLERPRLRGTKSIITQMADNARILMATRPFLRYSLHITFCGSNFNLMLFDRNGVVISRSYNFQTHLSLFIRIIRRLTCEMTAYDLGLDTTVRPEGSLGSAQYPSYLVKLSGETWYKTEGVPLWQSTSLIGRGTLVFRAREHNDPNGVCRILKNAWRGDERLKESELYQLMQNGEEPLKSMKSLAKWIVGGDITLENGAPVTISGHREQFKLDVIGNGATLHRLVLASHGKSLASYTSFKQLLRAAGAILHGMKFVMAPF